MSGIEKIQTYIERTGVKYSRGTPYQLSFSDLCELYKMADDNPAEALCLAFEYGRAKGERSARAAQKVRAEA